MIFEEIYDDYFEWVWRALRRIGVPQGDAQDAAQDVFIVVHRRLHEFEGRSKITTWLFAICLRVASDRRRSARGRYEVVGLMGGKDPADERQNTAEHTERREQLEVLEQILEEIPLEQRIVFTLFELERMAGEEIADLLTIPIPTVHSRLRLARESFRNIAARWQSREQFRLHAGAPTR